MWLTVENLYCRVTKIDPAEETWLSGFLTFRPEGGNPNAQPMGFFNRRWGTFPTGFLPLVRKEAVAKGFSVETADRRARPPAPDLGADLSWLRDYQREAAMAMLRGGRGILWAPTGSGKSECAIALSRLLPSTRFLFLVHRKDLLVQAAERYYSRTGDTAGQVGDGVFDPRRFTCATFQTLYRRLEEPRVRDLLAKETEAIIVDEVHCFPAGTLVGGIPIERLRVGDRVVSYDEQRREVVRRRIRRVFVSRPDVLVRVHLANGRAIVCTPGHPFLTSDAHWQPAHCLRGKHVLVYPSEEESFAKEDEGGRRAEGAVPLWVGVDSVEVLKPSSDGTFGGLCPDGLVYNLEVEGTHTYISEGVVVHNCLPAASFWRVVMRARNAYFRWGMSGTPLARTDRRDILIIAATGPVLFRIRPQVLIEAGVLSQPRIHMVPCRQAGLADSDGDWHRIYRIAVVESQRRNAVVVDAVRRAQKPCLVFVKEIEHGRTLQARLRERGLQAEFVWGSDSTAERQAAIRRARRGDTEVLISSPIWEEGVDIPELRSVVVASGGKSAIKTLQRLGRGMRVVQGKSEVELWDFKDSGHRWLSRHTNERREAYLREGFEVSDWEPPAKPAQLALDAHNTGSG